MAGSSPIVDKDDGRCLPMKLTIHLTTEEARTIHDTTERNTTESPTQEGFGDSGFQVLQLAGSREPRINKKSQGVTQNLRCLRMGHLHVQSTPN